MTERHVSKQGLSVIYQITETPGAIPKPEMSDIMAVSRICQALKGAIGEYPKGKGPEVPMVDQAGKPVLDEKTGEPRKGRLWKVDYPKAAMAVLRLDTTDFDILLGIWDRHDKSRFFSDEEMRDWVVALDCQLRDKPVPGKENRAVRRKKG